MSFASTFSAALASDVSTQLSIDLGDVYLGLEPRKRTLVGSPEVWVEYRGHESVGRGSGDGSKLHMFTVHLRLQDKLEAAQTWAASYATLEAHAETLVDLYDGACPFVATIANVVQAKASVGEADVPEGVSDPLDLPVLLEVHES